VTPKLTLNIKTTKDEASAATERVKTAAKKKADATESIDAAWARILDMKNSDSDQAKLIEVKNGMDAGLLGREPASASKRFSKAEALRLWRQLREQLREDTLRKMVEETPDNYWLITDERKLREFTLLLSQEDEIVFDVETTGVDVWNDYIVGHVITAVKADIHAYIPTKHKTDHPQLPNELVLKHLKPIYEDDRLGKLAHNAKFDIHMLDRDGINLRGLTWDTQEAMRMLNENEPSFALKNLVTKYLNIPSLTYGDLFGQIGFDEVSDLRIALAYAAKDGDVTLKLRNFQRQHLAKMPGVLEYFQTVEVPLIKTLVYMESTGFQIDKDYAKTYGAEMKADIERMKAELLQEFGDINIDSPAQLKPALERITGLTLISTDAKKVLKPLAGDYPIIEKLLKYKGMNKLYSTYIGVLPELIDPRTGKLHTNFNQNGAKTGRLSSGGESGVNLQNQPYPARKLFIAPPGYVLLGGDWSQQEVRCLAYFTQEPTLLEAYQTGRDIYSSMASEVFGKPYEECGDGTFERKAMKTGVLASMYGTGPKTLGQQLGISEKEAKSFLADFFDRLPLVKEWIDENTKFVRRHGFVYMDGEKRKRRLPMALDRKATYGQKSQADRQATNARVQGSSAIQSKTTLNALYQLCQSKRDWRMWVTVHDEALLIVPETVTREDVAEFESVMVNTYAFGNVPNKCDIEISRRWGEGMSVDEWFRQREETN
jgi:DNA polymerase-1